MEEHDKQLLDLRHREVIELYRISNDLIAQLATLVIAAADSHMDTVDSGVLLELANTYQTRLTQTVKEITAELRSITDGLTKISSNN